MNRALNSKGESRSVEVLRQPGDLFNMSQIFQVLSKFIPATHMMEIGRGVILRSAGLTELWLKALILFCYGSRGPLL